MTRSRNHFPFSIGKRRVSRAPSTESVPVRASRRKYAMYIIAIRAMVCSFALLCAIKQKVNAQTYSLSAVPCQQFFSATGVPLAGGFVYTYVSGTLTPAVTYADSTGATANTNPIILNAGGYAVSSTGSCGIWLSSAVTYTFIVFNSANVQQWSVKGITGNGASLLGLANTWTVLNSFNAAVNVTGAAALHAGGTFSSTFGGTLTLSGNWLFNGTTTLNGSNGFNELIVDNDPLNSPQAGYGVHTVSLVDTIRPCPLHPTRYPLGCDGGFGVYGPADIHLMNIALETTSSTSVSLGVNTVTVSGTTLGGSTQTGNATALFSDIGGASLVVDPGTANQETVSGANWAIASGSTLTITFANTHTAPYRIRQEGTIFAQGPSIQVGSDWTLQEPSFSFNDSNAQCNWTLSRIPTNKWPLNGFGICNFLTGGMANGNLNFRQNNSASTWNYFRYDDGAEFFEIDAIGNLIATGSGTTAQFANSTVTGTAAAAAFISKTANIAGSGVVRLASTDVVSWRNNANRADLALGKNSSDQLTWSGNVLISAGKVTLAGGTGAHSFSVSYGTAPICTATDNTAANAVEIISTTAGVTLTGTSTDVVTWICTPASN